MPQKIKLKKGLNINLAGAAKTEYFEPKDIRLFSLRPSDFPMLVPKMLVKEGDVVKCGSPVFYSKDQPQIIFASPVSGSVKAVVRGEKRRILEIVIESDGIFSSENYALKSLNEYSAEELKELLLKSGLWPFIKQRPYGIAANPNREPKSIFISCFDTAPLAPDYDFIMQGQEKDFYKGIEVLQKLTKGKIHLGVSGKKPVAPVFSNTPGVVITEYIGPHPAGNPGVQIHHTDPINKDEIVWTLNPQDVLVFGRFFNNAAFDTNRIVAVTGSEQNLSKYFRTRQGACIQPVLTGNTTSDNVRYISGNVLTGTQIPANGYLGFFDSQITVIPEGNHHEFIGWALPGFNKYSFSKTFFSWLRPGKQYVLDTNYHGGERALVVTGEYEKVVPMDILPMQLLKAIIIEDIDLMEKLGIYEVIEEDLALCEFICTSKTEIQSIVRKGLNQLYKEMN